MQVKYYSLFDDNAGVQKPLSHLIEATAISYLRIMYLKRERKKGQYIHYMSAVYEIEFCNVSEVLLS